MVGDRERGHRHEGEGVRSGPLFLELADLERSVPTVPSFLPARRCGLPAKALGGANI
jgi:hypothetical protein